MVCPKCGKELMNVNGRNICIDCGTEVPEEQMSTLSNFTEQLTTSEPVSPASTPNFSPDSVESIISSESAEPVVSTEVSSESQEPALVSTEESTPEIPQVTKPEASISELTQPENTNIDVESEILTPEQILAQIPENEPQAETASVENVPNEVTVENQTPETINTQSVETLSPQTEVENSPEESMNIPINTSSVDNTVPEVSQDKNTPEKVTDYFSENQTPEETPVAQPAEKIMAPELVDPFDITDPVPPIQNQIDPGLLQEDTPVMPESLPQDTQEIKYPSNNRSLYILLGIGGFLLVLLLAGGLFAYFSLSKPAEVPTQVEVAEEWKEFKEKDFIVEFPTTPEASKETLTINDTKISLSKASIKKDGVTYAIAYGNLPETIKPTVELTEFISALAKANNGTVSSTEVAEFDGQKANEYIIKYDDNTLKGKVITKNNTIYLLEYISKGDNSDNFSKFIDSFSFRANDLEGNTNDTTTENN